LSPARDDAAPSRATWRHHPLELGLRLFADVRPGEAVSALVLTLDVFLLLTAYYLLKVAREPLILTGGGAEVKSYASVGQSILLVFVASFYGWLAQRVDRLRLIAYVTLFFVANLFVFWILGVRGVPLGVPFFLWVGIFNVTVIAQFWSFAADIYSPEQGKRIFPILGIGSSVGAVAGAAIAGLLNRLGPYNLMIVASGILLVCLALTYFVHRRESARAKADVTHHEEPIGGTNGFVLLLQDRYLLLLGALIFVLNAVNKTGEYALDRALLADAHARVAELGMSVNEYIGRFKSDYFEYVNVLGVTLQLFAVSRILKYLGVRRALFIMPLVSFVGYSTAAFFPLLGVILAAKVAENGLDYSLANTSQQALWLVTTRDAKYKVKQVIDTFLFRAGDVMSAGLVWAGTHLLAFGTEQFIVCNVGLVVLWAIVLWFLTREHAKRTSEAALPAAEAA
jgi:AAA family ATP:ADP antiporter